MFLKTTEYALRAVIYIAQKGSEEKKLGLSQIAKAIDSPQSFTAKILQQLTSGNKIVSSARGPNGGFYISERSKNLPVYSILEAMGEDEILKKCVLGLKRCSETNPCPLHHQYKLIKPQLIKMFETKTIKEMADKITSGSSYIGNKKI